MAGRDDAGIYWWETAPQDSRPSLTDRVQADVAIVGGGYTGLWTAYQLLEAEPSLKIVILEGQRIGFGASGRNGGFAMTLLDMSLAHLRKNQGDGPARDAHQAVARSVEEMGETITSQGIECEWKHGGLMVVASNPGQLKRVDADVEAAEALGLEGFRRLSAGEARAEVDSPTYIGALHEEHCGVLHPAKLAHGLARTVERAGATIYERTESTGIEETGDGLMRISTPRGEVAADQVVLATNAWACQTPWFKRKVVPLYTYIALTEPLTDLQWASIGWDRHQGIEDKRNYVHYYRRTLDGRILWGGSDGIVHSRSRIRPEYVRHDGVLARLRSTFEKTFPQVADVPFSHHWGGPVAITAPFIPYFGTLIEGRLHYGLGYNGHGVAPSHTGGKVLADKVLGKPSEYTELCFVDSKEAQFPPEPLRWIGAELTRRALKKQDDDFEKGIGDGEMDPLLLRIVKKLS